MKRTYLRPEIWVDELMMDHPLLGNNVSNIQTNNGGSALKYGEGGDGTDANGGAPRANYTLWDEWDED